MLADRLRRYRDRDLRDDLVAGFIVAILLIPQSLAYALLAGLPPQIGVYASLLPMLAYAALGSSSVNSVGPVAVVALMTAQAVQPLLTQGVAAHDAALVLAAETGLLLAAAALFKLDALAALLSTPVLHGFSTGAALVISLSQLPALLGSDARGFTAPEVLQSWWQAGRAGHLLTAAIGGTALALLVLARRHARALLARWLAARHATLAARCAPLAVIALAIAVAWALDAGGRGVALVGALPPFAVPLGWPPLRQELWLALLPSAVPLALVTFVSSLAVSEGLALRRREQVDARRELAGLAGANVAAAFAAAMPVGGSFSRGAVNAEAGARTRAAGAWTAGFMALAMLLLAAPLALLPKAVLAASIVLAVLGVVEWRAFAEAWRYARSEFVVMVVVALLTLLVSSQWALAVGVALSVGLLLQRSANPHVARIGRVGDTEHYRNVDRHAVQCVPGVLALRIDESLLFTNARRLAGVVAQHLAALPDTRRVVLLMSPVNRIDFSAYEALRAVHDLLAERGIRLDLSEVKGPVMDALRAGRWEDWFRGRVYLSHHQGMVAGD
ncbi:MAG: STAS domain-containing protein [Piscinibacter sp.]|nr:STAS domain-containing protein [Piscinibacter sp.]